MSRGWMITLALAIAMGAGIAQESPPQEPPAEGPPAEEPTAAAPTAVELLSITVERTRVLAKDPGASPTTARGNQLVLRLRVDEQARAALQDRGDVILSGRFDDPEATAVRVLPGTPKRMLLEARKDGSSVLHLACALPPEGATAITDLSLLAGRAAGDPLSQIKSYFEVKDLRASVGEPFGRPGHDGEEWYRVEGFGPKNISMRRLTEAAPPISELHFVNVENAEIQPIPLASKSIRDPSDGTWVAILVFEQHVPLVVNLWIPIPSEPVTLLELDRVKLP